VIGETPKCLLNAREKWLRLEKPTRWATVSIGIPPPCSRSFQARSIRIRRTMLIGDRPKALAKVSAKVDRLIEATSANDSTV
jgi:hypothetical protein